MEHMFSFVRRLNREPNFHPSGFMTLNSLRGRRVPYRDRSMGEIHHAAMVGDVWRMKKILFLRTNSLNDRDKMSRTALHLACAHGHPKVVRLLVNRKCLLDLCDVDNETALIQAVQYQQEECATILLDHGANPNVVDINGNTALHYAVLGENLAIVEKLLSCSANVEVKNKDGLTPLSLAQHENKEQMVLLLVNSGATLPTVNEMESNQQQTSENEEGRRPKTSYERSNLDTDLQESPKQASRKTNSKTVDECSEEDSLRSNPGLDNSWDLSDGEDRKDEVISKPCMLTAKTSENQSKQTHLTPLHLEKKSPESELCMACDRADISEGSGHSSVQNYDKKRSKQERLEERKKLKLAREELKQKCHEFCVKFNYVSDEKPKPPNVVPFDSRSWSSEDSTWSSNSEVCLGEKTLHSENDHKPDTEHVLNKMEKSFCDDTENKKGRNPVVPFEGKEDQEFDMQMTKNMNPNTTNWKLGMGHAPQSSDPKSHLDLQLVHGNETEHMIPIKSQDASAVTSACKETKPNQDSFQKPLNVHNYNVSNRKSMESILEDWSSSSPCSDGSPKVHVIEKLQQDMQRFRNTADMCTAELLAVSKENVQLLKQDKLTPQSLAQGENQEQTVEFLAERKASTHAVDEMESNPSLDNSWDLSDDEDWKDEVISKPCTSTAETSENQRKRIHLPPLHLEKKSPELEMNRACDRADISEESGHSSVQNYDKKRAEQERSEEKKLKLAREELKQKCPEFRVKFKDVSDEKPKPPNVVPFHSRTWSSEDSTWSSNAMVCLGEKTLHSENDHKPHTGHILNKKEEIFCDDTENKKVRNPVVPFEVKEDQEFDMQMTKNMNPNTTNWKLGMGHAPQSSDPKSHLDLRLAHGNETKPMIPIKCQAASAVPSACKETKPNQDSFQKPLNVHNYNASNRKSVESNLGDWSSSSSCSDGSPEVHVIEKLQQDMQRFRNTADMCRAELLAVRKENEQLLKEDKLTPQSLAQGENQEQTVEFLAERKASTHAVDEMDSNPGLDNSWDLSDDEDWKDEVISKPCTSTAETSENQRKRIHLPPLHLEKKSPELEMNRACDRADISEESGHSSVQNYDKKRAEQERSEEKKLKLAREELKQKCPEFRVKFKDVSDEKPKPPNVVPFHSRTWSSEDSTWSSNAIVCLGEKTLHSENDHKPHTGHVLNKKEEIFCDDTENKKVRNPVVPFEVKEDQEFDMQMTKNMNPNTTNWKLGMGHAPQSSDPKSHLDLRLAHGNETKPMIPIKCQAASAVPSACKETKPNQDSFQKPLNVHNYNASNRKSVESNLGDWSSSSSCNDGSPEVHVIEKLQQDMQRFQNTADMCRAERLAVRKENEQLLKEDKLTPQSLAQGENQEQTVEFLAERKASTHAVDEMESHPGLDNSWDLSDDENGKVSDHYEQKEYLLHENHMLKDENAKLILGKGTVKNQNQKMEKKFFENIKIVKEKNDHLHKTIKHNEEILTETIFQHNGQLNVSTAEVTMLNLKLENEKRNRERLETEVESYKSRLATAKQDHEQCQASKRDLQLAFQRERDEWFCLQDKMNFDMSNLKDNNEILSQELSKAESKFSSLEIELNHTRDDLRERTLVLEGVQRDLSQTQGQKKEMEHIYQKERDKLHKYVVKQRSLKEKLSHLQSENKLLRQQLDDAHNKADDKEKTLTNTQNQCQDIIKALQTENEKQVLMLNERNKELTNECSHLKKTIYQYENDKAERDAYVSQLQQELADTLRKLSVLEASLEVTSHYHMNLEDEPQDLTKKLDENRSQVEEENKKQRTHKKEVEGNIYYIAAADSDGIIQQTKSTQTDNQQYPMENEYSDRFILKEDTEKRQKSDLLYEEEMEQLRNKEQKYTKEVEINPQLEGTVRTQEMEMNIISDSYEKEYLLRENHTLQDENAKLRLEIDTVKNQNQEMEKKYFEDIKIIVEKNDRLNKTIQLTEKILTETMFQHNEQLNVLNAENALLNFDLRNEKQNRERLETEVESYKSRLATAIQDHEQCQASKSDLQLAFQTERDEWFCLRDKMNFDMSNLKDTNESLCQELSKAESKFSSLEIELNHTRDDLRKRTLDLESVQRDLSQTQGQKKEMEYMYRKEQDKVLKYVGKQGSLEEKLSHLQSENMLLQQQLDAAHNKADDKTNNIINIQDQLQDLIKILQNKLEKQGLMLNERNNECRHLTERIYQYENDKAERDAVVAQLQQELADTLKKQSTLEASLDVTSLHRMNLKDETQDLKRKLDENKSQLFQYQDENEKLKECVVSKLTLEHSLGEEIKKNNELKEEVTRLTKLLEMKQSKLTEQENEEFSFPRHLNPNQTKMDVQIDDLTAKLEAASSKCLRLDEENKFLQQELLSLKAIQEKCEKLENENQKWKQEVVNLKRHMQMNMVELSKLQQYQWTIEERARQYRQEVLEEANLFIQTQTLSQAWLDPLRENHNTSTILLELRVKELEFELSRMKMSHYYTLEKYKQIHLEEIEDRKSLTMKLNKTNEQLIDVRMELLLKEQENRFLLNSLKHEASPRDAWC